MAAEGIILAKSLISNLLRACAIVHWWWHWTKSESLVFKTLMNVNWDILRKWGKKANEQRDTQRDLWGAKQLICSRQAEDIADKQENSWCLQRHFFKFTMNSNLFRAMFPGKVISEWWLFLLCDDFLCWQWAFHSPEKERMRDEDYQLVEHPRLELHIHVATKFVQVQQIHEDGNLCQ